MSKETAPQPPPAEWFIRIQNQEAGPFTVDEMKAKIAAGTLQPWSFVRSEKSGWAYAKDHPILQAMLSPQAAAGSQQSPVSPPSQQAPAPSSTSTSSGNWQMAEVGIGGWLILVAFGLALAPLWTIAAIYLDYDLIGSRLATDLGIHNMLVGDILIQSGMLLFQSYVAIVFFLRRREAPFLVILLLLARVVVNFVEYFLIESATKGTPGLRDINNVVGSWVVAAIWVPYFMVSQRVKATFIVEPVRSQSATANPPTGPRISWLNRLERWLSAGTSIPKLNADPPPRVSPLPRPAIWSNLMQPNDRQRIVILVGVVAIVLMGAFPPWVYTYHASGGTSSEASAGYRFIAYPPDPKGQAAAHGVKLDLVRLLIQWFAVAAATGVGVFLTSKSHEDRNNSPSTMPKT